SLPFPRPRRRHGQPHEQKHRATHHAPPPGAPGKSESIHTPCDRRAPESIHFFTNNFPLLSAISRLALESPVPPPSRPVPVFHFSATSSQISGFRFQLSGFSSQVSGLSS